MPQLPADCLKEIFEYLEKDRITLHSCLFVNRLWCEVSVIILWRDVHNYSTLNYRTLIACLPNESKEILDKNGIIISTPTPKPPVFNYAAFCRVLSINRVNCKIEELLENQQFISSRSLNNSGYVRYIVAQEIYKLLMSQIPSLKMLNYYFTTQTQNIAFASYPGAKDCLKNLSELHCCSDIYPEFFYQLSTMCHNIQTLNISFEKVISNGLTDFLYVQQNLKYLSIIQHEYCKNLKDIIPSLANLPSTLIKLVLYGEGDCVPFSFITKFTNLQELDLSIYCCNAFEDFKKLQYVTFPQLQILKIQYASPRYNGLLISFLENNGKSLKELHIGDNILVHNSGNSLNWATAMSCPNIRKLSTGFRKYELETLQAIFNYCKYLESIRFLCGCIFMNEKEALEAFLKYSNENVRELILYHNYSVRLELLPEELESFFLSWRSHRPNKSFSLIIIRYDANSLDTNDENMKIIEKYIKLGVVKKFKVLGFDDDDY